MLSFQQLVKRFFFPLLLLIGYGALFIFLKDKLPFTPDFSGTDVFHFNISYKYHLWKSIRSGMIPFWTDLLSGGFPLVAESQMGTFFLPYYLIFPLFSSFSNAYSFLFSFHLFLLTIGMYFLLRFFKIKQSLAFLLSIIFAWNGSITFRWVHFIVLQSFSFTPILFWAYLKWNKSQKIKYLLLLSFILNQMIFSGYIQIVFISLLGLVSLYVLQNYPINKKKTILLACSIFFGILLSLPQILPTLQLSQYTGRTLSNSYDFAVSVPFNTRNLCSFFSADCLGTPQNASYSTNWKSDGIYWENTPYIGQLFVILLVLSSFYLFKVDKKNKLLYIYFFLFFLFLLLALGHNSPLYFLFSIFPFNMFRTPPRYLLISVFFLIIYSSLILQQVVKKNTYVSLLIYIALILNCILLIHKTFAYNLFVESSLIYQFLNSQKIVKSGSFYITYGAEEQWNKIFSKEGWSTKENVNDYLFINRSLIPNSNLIPGQASFDIYASLEMRRQKLLKSIITEGLAPGNPSEPVENLLQLYNISSIISFKPLALPHFKPVQTMKKDGITITTYQNINSTDHPEYYVPKTVHKVTHVEEVEDKLYTGILTQEKSVAESIQESIVQNPSDANLQIDKKSDSFVKGAITSKGNTFIALRKNWYPEWKLYIEGKEQKIYKTNLIHLGFFAPKGTHPFELIYVPISFYIGCVIAFLGVIGVVILFRSHFNTHGYGLSLRAKHTIAKQSQQTAGLPRRYAPRNDK